MKELYTSPEMKIMSFAPVERLANSGQTIVFDDLMNGIGSTPVISNVDDVDVGFDISL